MPSNTGTSRATPEWLMGAAAIVIAIAAVIVTVQLSRVSDLSGDIRSTAGRIDQIYPVLTGLAADIGGIKGSLEVSAQKIAMVADGLSSISGRLEAAVKLQEGQTKNIDDLTAAVGKLTTAVTASESQLSTIANDVKAIKDAGPIKKTDFNKGVLAVGTDSFEKAVVENLIAEGIDFVSVKDVKTWDDLAVIGSKYGIDLSNIWISTSDPKTRSLLLDISKR